MTVAPKGPFPTGIVVITVSFVVLITDTVLPSKFVTYAFDPPRVTATP